jgi:MYXO-CTERM domain-containing protein
MPTSFGESFGLVQEGVTWFGPTVALTVEARPAPMPLPGAPVLPMEPETPSAPTAEMTPTVAGGCSVGRPPAAPPALLALLLAPLLLARRKRR